MRSIYQDALQVLALDSGLLSYSCSAPSLELCVRLKLSTWMRRLWTFQEAILPKEVHVRFSDGARTLQDIAQSLQRDEYDNRGHIYRRYGQLWHTFFDPFITKTKGDLIARFKATWKQLQWRSTTYQSDETICLATLLGLDVSNILEFPWEDKEQRMISFLRQMETLPILFAFQPPPRLETCGFRWAPASFLNCFRETATNPFRLLSGTATFGPDNQGLNFSQKGFIFKQSVNPSFVGADDFHIAVSNPSMPLHSVGYRWKADREARNISGASKIERPALVYLATDLETNPAILVDVLKSDSDAVYIEAAYIAVVFVAPVARFPDDRLRGGVTYQVDERPTDQQWVLY